MNSAISRCARCAALSFLLLSLASTPGCGGGGGSSGGGQPPPSTPPPVDPFGLTQRASLASLQLPDTGSGGTFSLAPAYPNLTFTSALFFAGVPGDRRAVVVEQNGRILAFTDDPSATTSRLVLDLSGRVLFAGEQGLLGLAFDPDFIVNRYVYLHYIEDAPRRSVISRMRWDVGSDLIEPASEKVILEVEQPFANHNAGMLAFGPDEMLYVAMGDGGSGGDPLNNAQDRSTLLGNVLRLDVHPADDTVAYELPADNPFIGETGVREEIFAWGLRNPFRFSFDRQTGELWLGDVGQNEIEEVNVVTSGGNYGWRVFEGTRPFDNSANTLPDSAFTPPVFEYDHSQGISVIGGYVYRGSRLANLFGRYLLSDFGSGSVWALTWDGSGVTDSEIIATAVNPTSFGEKNDGDVVVVSRGNGIFQLEDGGAGGQIPALLSETGVFSDLTTLAPASGLVEYAPNHPFWSDNASKRRWIGIPDAANVGFTSDDWSFPVGSVAVKHFELALDQNNPGNTTRLETRILIHTTRGWEGFTYRWNDNGTEAALLSGRETAFFDITEAGGGTRQQQYDFPSRTDCLSCHTQAAGFVLGVKTPQLNGDFDYSGVVDNQLRSWNNVSLFDRDIGDAAQYTAYPAVDDTTAAVAERARAYLEVNCSQCHQPGGTAPTNLDLRASVADGAMNAIGITPSAGDLGAAGANIITAGDRNASVLWLRMQALDGNRMPPLSTHLVDEVGSDVVGAWIDSL